MSLNEYYEYRAIEHNQKLKDFCKQHWYFGFVPKWVKKKLNITYKIKHIHSPIKDIGIGCIGRHYEYCEVYFKHNVKSVIKRKIK